MAATGHRLTNLYGSKSAGERTISVVPRDAAQRGAGRRRRGAAAESARIILIFAITQRRGEFAYTREYVSYASKVLFIL